MFENEDQGVFPGPHFQTLGTIALLCSIEIAGIHTAGLNRQDRAAIF